MTGAQSPIPLNRHLATLRLVRECPEAGPPGCGCDARRACRRLGRDVAPSECHACARDRLSAAPADRP